MTRTSGFGNTTSSVAKCAAVICAVVCILLIAKKHSSARSKIDAYQLEVQGWEACRRTNPSYFATCKDAASLSQKNLDEAQSNFWINLPKAQLAGFLILAASASGTGGYFTTRAVFWLGSLGVCRFIKPLCANQVRESPSVIDAKSAHREQNRQGFRALEKGRFAGVPDERGKQKGRKTAIGQLEKLHEQITQLQQEIANSRRTEVRLEKQITHLTTAKNTPQRQAAERRRAGEHSRREPGELPVAHGPLQRDVGYSQGNSQNDDSHHVNNGKAKQKLCRKCKKQKAESDFHRDRSCKDGLARWCKQCKAKAAREYRKRQAARKN
jgi:hypothetical protein